MALLEPVAYLQGFPLTSLPRELQAKILGHAIDTPTSSQLQVLQVSSVFHQWGLAYLYRRVTLTSRHALSCFLRTLKQHPEYSRYVRVLEVYSARINWNEAIMMARIIDRAQSPADRSGPHTSSLPIRERVKVLRVRFPADDINQALDFFCHFEPEQFEWITQPCWLLRPGELFMRFLIATWSQTLHTLRLGNFDYDAASFARSITALPALSQLTLMGTSNRLLDPDTVRTILGTGETATHLRWLLIADCPQRRRTILERDLGVAIPVYPAEANTAHTFDHGFDSCSTNAESQSQAQGRFETTAGCVKFCPRCRIQARERVMQRYGTDPGAHALELAALHPEAHPPSLSTSGIASHPASSAQERELPLPSAHHDFVRCRVLESMRWLP